MDYKELDELTKRKIENALVIGKVIDISYWYANDVRQKFFQEISNSQKIIFNEIKVKKANIMAFVI